MSVSFDVDNGEEMESGNEFPHSKAALSNQECVGNKFLSSSFGAGLQTLPCLPGRRLILGSILQLK